MTKNVHKTIYNYREYQKIVSDSHSDPLCFITTSIENYNEALLINQSIVNTFQLLRNDIRLIKKVKDSFGIELYVDPLKEYSDRFDFLTKIWNKIVAFFKRLGMAIGNFIRSIATTIGSFAFKKQSKFYDDHKATFHNMLVHLKNDLKIKCKLPSSTDTLQKFITIFPKYIENLNKNTETFEKYTKQLNDIYTKIQNGEKVSAPLHNVEMTLNSLKKNMNFSNAGFFARALPINTPIPTNLGWLKTSPAKIVEFLIYEEKQNSKQKKYIDVEIGKFFKYIPFEFLSQQSAAVVQQFVKEGRITAKNLNKEIGYAKTILAKVERLAGGKDLPKSTFRIINSYQLLSAISRNLYSFIVSIILNIFKEFIKLRSYCYRGAQLVIHEYNTQ